MVGDAHPTAELAMVRRTDYSDDSASTTQRRSFMQRSSSAIFWLLLAATLAVDALAVSWVYMTTLEQAGNLYFALVCSQISVVCIGSSCSSVRGPRRWMWPWVVSLAVAAVTTWLAPDRGNVSQSFLLYLSLWLPQVAILVAILWLLQRTPIAKRGGYWNGQSNWQFSVAHLLIVTTVCAILLVILRLAEEWRELWLVLAAWLANNTALAVAALLICTMPWHGFLRLGATLGVSLVFALLIEKVAPGPDALPVNSIQAIVLVVWLIIGGIVPRGAHLDDDCAGSVQS